MNDSVLMVDAAVNGLGLIYTVDDAIKDQLNSGKLEQVLAPFAPGSSGFCLYYPQRSQLQPKLRAFVDHVKEFGPRVEINAFCVFVAYC